MACSSSIEILNSIKTILENQIIDEMSIQRPYGVWTEKRKGKHVQYETTQTYTGSACTYNLDFLNWASVKRIDQIWNDATSKDISIRLMKDQAGVYYSELKAATGDTNTSMVLSPTAENELMFPSGGRLQFYYGTNTIAKIVTIIVVVDEL